MVLRHLQSTTFWTLLSDAFVDRGTRWLHAAFLAYVALLPFNAFGFTVFLTQRVIKFTEVALLAVVIFGVIAFRREQWSLRKAYWLYVFLLFQVVVQFASLIGSGHPREGFPVAVAVASYSALVFILVNTVRSMTLIRGMFVVMAASVIVIVGHSVGVFFSQDWVFNTRLASQPSILGNEHTHYLAYILILHGIGVVYLAYTERHRTWRALFWIVAALWMYVIVLTASKTAHLSFGLLLIVLLIALYKEYGKVLVLAALFAGALALQAHIVPVRNAYLAMRHADAVRARQITPHTPRTAIFTQHDIAEGIESMQRAAVLEVQRIAAALRLTPLPAEPSGVATVAVTLPRESPPAPREPVERGAPPRLTEPPPVSVPSGSVAEPMFIGEYSEENLFHDRWRGGIGIRNSEVRTRGFVAGWYMGMSRLLRGVGVGQSPYHMDDYSEEVRRRLEDPRFLSFVPFRDQLLSQREFPPGIVGNFNIFLNAWAETGLLGILAFTGILVSVLTRVCIAFWRIWGTQRNRELHFLLATFLALFFFNQLNPFWVHPWLWTAIATIYALATISVEEGAEAR